MIQLVYVSFDCDNDRDLKATLIDQARNPDSPFEIASASEDAAGPGWAVATRARIARSDQMIVLCGAHTSTATGVNAEIEMARHAGISYFLLSGRPGASKPTAAGWFECVYKWTWRNLESLIWGQR